MPGLLGVRSEARWLRFVPPPCPPVPSLPGQSGCNERLRGAVALIKNLIRELAADADLWTDPVWVVDSTPVECARSRPTLRRSNLAGYSYCPSHSRFFWAPAAARGAPRPDSPHLGADRPELDERPVLMAIRDDDPTLTDQRIGLTIIGDKATSRPSSTGSSSNGV